MPDATGTFAPFVIIRKPRATIRPSTRYHGAELHHLATLFQARAAR
jgi:hypothetical protein